MKNQVTIILFYFLLTAIIFPRQVHAVSTTNNIAIEASDKGFGNEIVHFLKAKLTKAKLKIASIFTDPGTNKLLLILYTSLLVAAGMLLGFSIVFIGILLLFTEAAILGLVVVVLGAILPIALLFLSFRPILRNHYKRMDVEKSQKLINLQSFLLSLIPGVLGILYFAIISSF